MLNGKELHNEGVIVNHLEENLTQHGCDIRLRKVSVVKGQGFIPREGKTMLPSYEEVRYFPDINGNEVWHLPPGYYMVDFIEGCNIPKNKMGRIVQRSSVARCGAWIYSSIFDAGFILIQWVRLWRYFIQLQSRKTPGSHNFTAMIARM